MINLRPICYKYKLLSIWGLVNEILYVNVAEMIRYHLLRGTQEHADMTPNVERLKSFCHQTLLNLKYS